MKPCLYRAGCATPGRFACSNLTDLEHSGTVAEEVCAACPYATMDTAVVSLDVPRAAPGTGCGSCGETKHRVTGLGDLVEVGLNAIGITKPRVQRLASAVGIDNFGCDGRQALLNRWLPFGSQEQAPIPEPLQFVWCYWHGGANGDEIRWSVRSVEAFFAGQTTITIIGDRPPWYQGHLIPKPRIKACQSRPFRDMLSKMHALALSPEIMDRFVWMMDDIYFIKPFTLEALERPLAERWNGSSKRNGWLKIKARTMQALQAVGRTTHDYATHLPHVVEKEKLKHIIGEFNLTRKTLLWEVLYGNTFRQHPVRTGPFFARIRKPLRKDQYQHILKFAGVCNHVAGAWCKGLRDYLAELLPNASPTEIEGAGSVKFVRIAKEKSIVKRRPRQTHRAFIERQSRQAVTQ